MSQKNKNTLQENIQDMATQIGTVAMSGAMVLG